jgi:1-acyl-sn-glycerol-3-phosphate acyltransferase
LQEAFMKLEGVQASDSAAWRSALRTVNRIRIGWLTAVTLVVLSLVAASMALVALATMFRARRFYQEVMARWLGWAVLRIWGIRVNVHQAEPFPETQTIYLSNHPSTLDIFVLISLGLPNTRFFMSSFLRWFPPLGVISTLIGVFHTPRQKYPARRVRCFQAAERALRKSGESAYLSPEGRRYPNGVGRFNKGAFHLATHLGVPIVPLYIHTPPELTPGRGLDARPGVVDVFVKPPIQTRDWRIEELDRNRARVHEQFLDWEAKARAER